MAVTIGYIGATGRDIGYFGTAAATPMAININQIDPAVARAAFPGPNGTWNAAALRANVPNPFFGDPRHRRVRRPGDDSGRPAAAAVPAVRRRLRVRDDRRRTSASTTPRPSCSRSAPPAGGAAASATPEQHQGQPVRAGQHLPDPDGTAAEQLRPRRRVRHQQLRLAAPHHPGADHEVPQLRQGRDCGLFLDGWNASAVVELVSGSPLNAVMSGRRVRRPTSGSSAAGSGPTWSAIRTPTGSDTDRVVYEGNEDAPILRQRRLRQSRRRARSATPRAPIGDARYQFRKNIDLVIAKDTTFFGSHVGQVRFEILNLTNTAKFRGIDINAVDSTELRPHHAAGRVHADLAAQLPLHVLSRAGTRAGARR